MKRKKDMVLIGAGLLVGMMMTPSLASAAENWLKATPSTQFFIVDGQNVDLEAYAIGGNNYVKLRDIGKAVGFNVYWDGAVQIESDKPYTGEAPTSSTGTDHAKNANPAIFTDYLTPAVYNTIRQAVVTGETASFGPAVRGYAGLRYDDDEALFQRAEEEEQQIQGVLAKIGQYPDYQLIYEDGTYLCQVRFFEKSEPTIAHTKDFIDSLNRLSEREKIKQIAWYVCDRIAYDKTCYVWPNEALAQDGVTRGACMSYAYSFQFLCQQAGIPCILVSSGIHQWNMAYAEGRWWDADLSACDVDGVTFQTNGAVESEIAFDGTDEFRENYYVTADRVLWDRATKEYLDSDYTDARPEVTQFAKEVLVPGSTK